MRPIFSFLVIIPLLIPQPALACLWDSETLAMERERFPEAHELIMGMFVRHSETYYEWRVEKILAKQQQEWALIDYDDLAVAYDKLGQQDKAIETIQKKMERWPEQGRYESEANLGTFYIHSGQFEKGLVHINKAIEINPDAHFGREVYQKLLVEYVLKQRAEGATLPLHTKNSANEGGFARFVLSAQGITDEEKQVEEINKAIKGVLGMMRFGHHDSPVLLEALGDLFRYGEWEQDAVNLANRAYEKASFESVENKIAIAYYKKTRHSLKLDSLKRPILEKEFLDEIKQGEEYFAQIKQDEEKWIAANEDVDYEFAYKYYESPIFTLPEYVDPLGNPQDFSEFWFALFVILFIPGMITIGYILFRERKVPEAMETEPMED